MPEEVSQIEKSLKLATKKRLGTTQLKSTQIITSPDGTKILKVFTVVLKPEVNNYSIINGQVKFEGNLNYNVLAYLENGEITTISASQTFSQNFENSQITADSVVQVEPMVLDVSLQGINNNEVTYESIVNFEVFVIDQNQVLNSLSKQQDMFTKENEINVSQLLNRVNHSGIATLELNKDSKTSKILYYTVFGNIKNIFPNNDYFVVSGDISVTIISEGEDGQLRNFTKEVPFNEEIEARGTNKDSVIQAQINVKNGNLKFEQDKNNFIIDIPFNIDAVIFNKTTFLSVVDVYNTKKEVNIVFEDYEIDELYPTNLIEENISAEFNLDSSMEDIYKILSVSPENISLVNYMVKDGEVVIEGIANVNVIYSSEDEDGNSIVNSIIVDIPYSLNLNIPEIMEKDEIEFSISLGDLSVKSKKGRELDVSAAVKINYSIVRRNEMQIATNVEIGENKLQKDYRLEFYVAKENQTMWDIAKHLNVATDTILEQNPDISLPISQGEKIVLYRQRVEE